MTIFLLVWAALIMVIPFRLWHRKQIYPVVPDPAPAEADDLPSVTVVIPARNEAANIALCAGSMLAQDYPAGKLTVCVVDDESTDGTGEIARRLPPRQHHLRVMEAGPLPPGWVGKPHACWQGAQAADTEWLLFTDADTAAEPGLLRAAMAYAQAQALTFLSLNPWQEMRSWAERLIMPQGFFLFTTLIDYRHIRDPRRPDAVANAQFMLVRREAYLATRGHAATPTAVLDDMALARVLKGHGYPMALVGGEHLIRTRMYTSLRQVWNGLSNTFAELIGNKQIGRTLTISLSAAALGLGTYIAPLAGVWQALNFPSWETLGGAAAAVFASTLFYVVQWVMMERAFRLPGYLGLTAPIGLSLSALIALNSLRRQLTGTHSWRGRKLPSQPSIGSTAPGPGASLESPESRQEA